MSIWRISTSRRVAVTSIVKVGIAGIALLLLLSLALPAAAQAPATGPVITSPSDGQTLQGQIAIQGTTDLQGFSSAELAFAYASDSTNTWFLIQALNAPAHDATLATWDTTAITDGDYKLRLRVLVEDGSYQDIMISVHIRNYAPTPTVEPVMTMTEPAVLEIPTAMILEPTATPLPSATALPPTPSALPPNPAGVTSAEIYAGFWRGALILGAVILAFALLIRLRRY